VNWNVKTESWRYVNREKNFAVEVHKWEEYGRTTWNKYLYLYPENLDFGKYVPKENQIFPDVPYEFNYGITYYHEGFDRAGNFLYQLFGDDYNHAMDMENPVGSDGARVFEDAKALIAQLEANHG
jgi:hypothetical protein